MSEVWFLTSDFSLESLWIRCIHRKKKSGVPLPLLVQFFSITLYQRQSLFPFPFSLCFPSPNLALLLGDLSLCATKKLHRDSRALCAGSFIIKPRLFLPLDFLHEICSLEIYFCVCSYPKSSACIFSCFHKHFKTHMYHCFSSSKLTQPAAPFTSVLQPLVYISYYPLVFKELSRLLTSPGQSFQSDILV